MTTQLLEDTESTPWFKNLRLVGGIILGTLIVGSGWVFFQSRNEKKLGEARNELYLAIQLADDELEKLAKSEAPAPKKTTQAQGKEKDSPAEEPSVDLQKWRYKTLDVDAQFPESIKKLEAVYQKYPKTLVAHDAAHHLGELYFNHSQWEKASTWFERSLEQAATPVDRTLSAQALASALENSGKYDRAVSEIEKALKWGVKTQKGELLLALARNQLLKNEPIQARITLDRILAELANTDVSKQAEMLKSRIE